MVAKKSRKQPIRADLKPEPTTVERLHAVRSRRLAVDQAQLELVTIARDEGLSWSTIGGALGVSGQAAQQWALRRA